jgi:hypothetical protein
MTLPTTETPGSRPAEYSAYELALLRSASNWARLTGIVGFVIIGASGLAIGLLIAARERFGITLSAILIDVVTTVVTAGVAKQLLAYSREVRAFLAQDAPALARAFASLRYYFKLAVLYLAFSVVTEVLTVVGIR